MVALSTGQLSCGREMVTAAAGLAASKTLSRYKYKYRSDAY